MKKDSVKHDKLNSRIKEVNQAFNIRRVNNIYGTPCEISSIVTEEHILIVSEGYIIKCKKYKEAIKALKSILFTIKLTHP